MDEDPLAGRPRRRVLFKGSRLGLPANARDPPRPRRLPLPLAGDLRASRPLIHRARASASPHPPRASASRRLTPFSRPILCLDVSGWKHHFVARTFPEASDLASPSIRKSSQPSAGEGSVARLGCA
ncbi:hypothetical protein PSCLAVI8L_150038 [Pseudoclavibacter sp. 8L]|nr:hypothetical protein PSCLAVI8L_150038 [Pseudoclavibacter sp. 8L]